MRITEMRKYAKNQFRSSENITILYLIIMIIGVVIPTAISDDRCGSDKFTVLMFMTVLMIAMSAFVGFLAGMTGCGYVNSKSATGYYHSLPLTRTELFVSDAAVSFVRYLAAFIPTTVIALIIFYVKSNAESYMNLIVIHSIVIAILSYILTYGMFMTAAGLSGTSVMRFIIGMIVLFLPVIVYLLIALSVGYLPHMNVSGYIDGEAVKWIFPAMTVIDAFICVVDGAGIAMGYVRLVMFSALFIAAALLLNRYRRSEKADVPVIWKPVLTALRYIVMIISSICLGALMFYITDETAWLVIGCALGIVISLIVYNLVVTRSSKNIFDGKVTLIVTCAVMVLYCLTFKADIFNIDSHVYPTGNTDSITLELNNNLYVTYKDSDDIETLVPLIKQGLENAAYYDASGHQVTLNCPEAQEELNTYWMAYNPVYDEDGIFIEDESSPSVYVYTANETIYYTQKPHFGITDNKWFRADRQNEYGSELLDFIYTSDEYTAAVNDHMAETAEEFESVMNTPADTGDSMERDTVSGEIRIYGRISGFSFTYGVEYDRERAEKIYKLLTDYTYSSDGYENGVLVGEIEIYGMDYYSFPVYSTQTEYVNELAEFAVVHNTDDYMSESIVKCLMLFDTETGDAVLVSPDNYADVLQYASCCPGLSSDTGSGRYALAVRYTDSDESDYIYGEDSDMITDYDTGAYSTQVIYIRPACQSMAESYFTENFN